MSEHGAFHTTAITVAHAQVLAALHGEAFAEGWSAEAFASSLSQPGAFGVIAVSDDDGEPLGFALLRAALFADQEDGEAEVLTIATRPGARRRGVARRVMVEALTRARELGVARVFLEVAENNAAAHALYESLGFGEVARRKAYYAEAAGTRADAVVMALELGV